jgi:hypothetical protein
MADPPPASRSTSAPLRAKRPWPWRDDFQNILPAAFWRKKSRINPTAERTAKAVAFLDAIMTNLAPSQHQVIHGVMKSVPDPFSGIARNVIIRGSDLAFWNELLGGLSAPNGFKRVTAVGTPGIGKSTTASFAIRLLLEQRKTVVYINRTTDASGYYIQFIPSEDEEGKFHVELIPETTSPTNIDSLSDAESYYVVDPGLTKTSCNPAHLVPARVIIVASPDERHWGGSSFTKNDQSGLGGFILYFPSWSLLELEARPTNCLVSNFRTAKWQSSMQYSVVFQGMYFFRR